MKVLLIAAIIAALLFYFFSKNSSKNSELAVKNIEESARFVASNRTKAGIIETASGLQYEIITQSQQGAMPNATSKVKVHYEGRLLNGHVFDSSIKRGEPITFGLNQVISGWTEGVQLMKEGDKFRFFIPANLAYGNRPVGTIPPGSLLIFEIELLEVN